MDAITPIKLGVGLRLQPYKQSFPKGFYKHGVANRTAKL